MRGLRYIEEAVTLGLDAEKCTGCGVCTVVCPHGVFTMGADKRAVIADRGACMECGACALNCAWGAISVNPGVGCAEAIIHSWIFGGEPTCGCATPQSASGSTTSAPGVGSPCCGGGPVLPRKLSPRDATTSGCGCSSGVSDDAEQAPGAA